MPSKEKKIRVCFPFVGDTIGGSHISALELINGLKDLGIEPVIAVHSQGQFASYLDDKGIEYLEPPVVGLVPRSGTVGQVSFMTGASLPLKRFLKSHAIDIVHANDERMHLTWLLGTRLAGRRFVWHQRTPQSSRRLSVYGSLADSVLTISQFCQQALPGAFGRNAIVLDNPFDTEAVQPNRKEARQKLLSELGAPDNAYIVGYVGNLIFRKRPRTFVECATRLRAQLGSPVIFPIVGDLRVPETDAVRQLIAERGLSDTCFLLGSRVPVEPTMAGFDVLVAPAVNEAFGRTLVEAMLVGTPVVAADHGGHREIIRNSETGFLIPPDDAAAMADVLEKLLKNPSLRRAICSQALKEARSRYSRARHCEEVAGIYKSLLRLE